MSSKGERGAAAGGEPKVVVRNLWKVFGPHAQRVLAAVKSGHAQEPVAVEGGHVIAVRDATFSVQPGEIFVIMGLSGSGKSTLVRCISRLIEPTGGYIAVDGAEVTAMDAAQLMQLRRHTMSMVFQHFGLFPHRTVLQNAAYGLEVQGMPLAQREALEEIAGGGDDDGHRQEEAGGEPLRGARGDVEVRHQRRQRHAHDGLVEDHHEGRDDENPDKRHKAK